MNRISSFLFGLLLGGLAGSVTGLLMAPARGAEFRRQITSYADQVVADVRLSAAQRQAELERELEVRRHPEMTS